MKKKLLAHSVRENLLKISGDQLCMNMKEADSIDFHLFRVMITGKTARRKR